MPRGRLAEVDLDDGVAMTVFENNISLKGIKKASHLVPYSQVNIRRRGPWSELFKHRALLLEMFRASRGYLCRQVKLQQQVSQYLTNGLVDHDDDDAEKLTYRIRVQMSHLRDHRVHGRRPSVRYRMLKCVLDMIQASESSASLSAGPAETAANDRVAAHEVGMCPTPW